MESNPSFIKWKSNVLARTFLEFHDTYTKLIEEQTQTNGKIKGLCTQLQEYGMTRTRFLESINDILVNLYRHKYDQDMLIATVESLKDDTSIGIRKASSELRPTGTPAESQGTPTGSSSNQQSQACISNRPVSLGKTQSEIPESPSDETPEDWIMVENKDLSSPVEKEIVFSRSESEAFNQNDNKSMESRIRDGDVQQQNCPSERSGNTTDAMSLESRIKIGDGQQDAMSLESRIKTGDGQQDAMSLESRIKSGQQQNYPSEGSGNTTDPMSLESRIRGGDVQQQNNPSGPDMDAIASAASQLNVAEGNPKADAPNVSEPKVKHKKVCLIKCLRDKSKPN